MVLDDDSDNEPEPSAVPDSIEAYLDSPTIGKSEVAAVGGALGKPLHNLGLNLLEWHWIFCQHQV